MSLHAPPVQRPAQLPLQPLAQPSVQPLTPPLQPWAHPPAATDVDALKELGAVGGLPRTDPDIHFLPIIGQVEGHFTLPTKNKTTKYEHVLPQLAAIEQDDRVQGVLILLHTVGGDIEAGLAIAEMIRGLSKPTASLVMGGGHSIGAPIAVAANRSFIAQTATVIVHPIRLTGMLIGVPQTYEYLDKMQDRIIRFIVANSRITEPVLRDLMFRTGELMRDVGTVLIGREAVDVGLIDELGTIARAIGYLRARIEERRRTVASGIGLPAPSGPLPPAPPPFAQQPFGPPAPSPLMQLPIGTTGGPPAPVPWAPSIPAPGGPSTVGPRASLVAGG